MISPILVIGNKTYSSWSLRGWLALKLADLDFQELMLFLDTPSFHEQIQTLSPTRQVPVLRLPGGPVVADSLAILEWAAEQKPSLWPADPDSRAEARAISAEMHSGFMALRQRCPMNLKRTPGAIDLDESTKADIARVRAIWEGCLSRFGGPFLFGKEPSGADVMYAPVATRFYSYALDAGDARGYIDTVYGWAPFKAWLAEALEEDAELDKYIR